MLRRRKLRSLNNIRQTNDDVQPSQNPAESLLPVKKIVDGSPVKLKSVNREELKHKTVLVFGLVKNISPHYDNLVYFLNQVKTIFGKTCFFYLTNNNYDNTFQLMNNMALKDSNIKGIVINDETITTSENNAPGNRVAKLAQYRNMCFTDAKNAFGSNFDYVLQVDTDLIDKVHADQIVSCFQLDEDFDAICSNGLFKNSSYHYDLFALRLLEDPYNIEELYPEFSTYYGSSSSWINRLCIFEQWTKVKAAWGGMMLYPGRVLNLDKLYDEAIPLNECEHISMCKKFKNIYVNPSWTYQQDHETEGTVYGGPMRYVPRDAGFFSVFNFYIGLLTMAKRVYPYWNFDMFKKYNGDQNPRHFAYFNRDITNSWFEFFEKVEHFKDDDTIGDFPITNGIEAPKEFRIPNDSKALYRDQEAFNTWRKETHKVFKKYIKLAPALKERVDHITTNHFKKGNMIGIHYRHPSHCCEQGIVMLRDYFKEVDSILKENPDANIFLATDTDVGVFAFQQKYGSKVGYIRESSRTSLDNLLEWAYARGVSAADEVGFIDNKGYDIHNEVADKSAGGDPKFGKDVIVDVYCLANCNWFVHTVSNLSLAVSYINPDVKMILLAN